MSPVPVSILQESRSETLKTVQQLEVVLQTTQKDIAQYAESDPHRVDAMRKSLVLDCQMALTSPADVTPKQAIFHNVVDCLPCRGSNRRGKGSSKPLAG